MSGSAESGSQDPTRTVPPRRGRGARGARRPAGCPLGDQGAKRLGRDLPRDGPTGRRRPVGSGGRAAQPDA